MPIRTLRIDNCYITTEMTRHNNHDETTMQKRRLRIEDSNKDLVIDQTTGLTAVEDHNPDYKHTPTQITVSNFNDGHGHTDIYTDNTGKINKITVYTNEIGVLD